MMTGMGSGCGYKTLKLKREWIGARMCIHAKGVRRSNNSSVAFLGTLYYAFIHTSILLFQFKVGLMNKKQNAGSHMRLQGRTN